MLIIVSIYDILQKSKKAERMKRKKETEQAEREGLEPPPKRIPKV